MECLKLTSEVKNFVFIVPSTHWDREWYLPFQNFRFKLVKLVNQLLEILDKDDYYFMLDGQTIVLEDYFEIHPEKKEKLLELIRTGKIAVGPWYILPDEWLVGQESLIRNLEVSLDLANELKIPMMEIGYLPDCFGHTRAIPQILSDLTTFKAAVIWRGVGSEITTIPFIWKSHENASTSILCNYMPFGYGNAASLPNDKNELLKTIQDKMDELKPYSPLPIFLLMNGTDHQMAQDYIINLLPQIKIKNTNLKISLLNDYIDQLKQLIEKTNYLPPIYSGEFRSSERAPLLQDTYSARMWIKQWDNKAEDLLVHYAEPVSTYLAFNNYQSYPTSYLTLAWKWLLKNQPHDSICGCSVDQTHEEMKSRYYWSESIADTIIEDSFEKIYEQKQENEKSTCLIFNPTNNQELPMYVEFEVPSKLNIQSVLTENGTKHTVQPLSSKEEMLFENTFKPFMLKSALKMLPGRKIMNFYINEVTIKDGFDPSICNILLILGLRPIGDLDLKKMKEDMLEVLNSGKYKQFYVKATMGSKQTFGTLFPLKPWSFNKVELSDEPILEKDSTNFTIEKNSVSNEYYKLSFNKDGTFNLYDKISEKQFNHLHCFEDFGDRGDEYTFSRLYPVVSKAKGVKRTIINKGHDFGEIEQELYIDTFYTLNDARDKRIGKTRIPVKTTFRFYKDLPRIDIKTELKNTAKNHRLRICFDLPFESEHSITSTHFGHVERKGDPIKPKEYIEMPSGIQAQKRFIRVNDEAGFAAITVFNKGLPEVELVGKSKIALTLIRSIGYLSREDYPERPIHAGPFMETPGAQELDQKYTFEYSIMIHSKLLSMANIYDHAEVFALASKSIVFENSSLENNLTKPILTVTNPMIRISSIRMRDNVPLILLYNISDIKCSSKIVAHDNLSNCDEVLIDGTKKKSIAIKKGEFDTAFEPFEIKLLKFS